MIAADAPLLPRRRGRRALVVAGAAAAALAASVALAGPATPAIPLARPDLGSVAFSTAPPARPAALRGPYRPGRVRRSVHLPSAPLVPVPPRDVHGVSPYLDAASSVIDPVAWLRNERAVAPLRAMIRLVDELGDDWLAAPEDPRPAAMALDALATWAVAGAMLGSVDHQGGYMRQWTLGALALDYLKIRDAPGLDPAERRVVERWLLAVGRAVDLHPPLRHGAPARNNHAYWAGLAVAAAGVAAGDAELFQAGLRRFDVFVQEVAGDGTLPLELARRRRALHYHLFALDALVMMAELAAANGTDLYQAGDHALARLVAAAAAGLRDPSPFERASGARQTVGGHPSAEELGWAELWAARSATPDLAPWLARARPLRVAYLGGDVTLAFGPAR